jgi:hypothetical protein
MARVKGFALRGLLKSVKESGGSIPAVLATLPDAERAIFARPIVTSEWYPYAVFVDLVRAIDRIQGKGDLAYAAARSAASTRATPLASSRAPGKADRPGRWLG